MNSTKKTELVKSWALVRHIPSADANIDGHKFLRRLVIRGVYTSESEVYTFMQKNQDKLRPGNYYTIEPLYHIKEVK